MPFNLQLDLFSAIEKLVEFHRVGQWVTLGIELACSWWFSFAFACGMALCAHRIAAEAIGEGLMAGTTMAVLVWRRSPLTKGMLLALPAGEASQEMNGNSQVISK